MKLSHFLYHLTSLDSFVNQWNETFNTQNVALIEKFIKEDRTKFFIKKVKEKSHHYHGLYFSLQSMIAQGQYEIVKNMVSAGLDINYPSMPLFDAIFDSRCKYHMETMCQTLIDLGFDINYSTIHRETFSDGTSATTTTSAIHNVIEHLRNNKIVEGYNIGFHIGDKRIYKFYNENDDAYFQAMNPTYQVFQKLIKEKIKINSPQEQNVISLALRKTHSLTVLLDLLTIDEMSIEYIEKGINEVKNYVFKKKTNEQINMLEFLTINYEKLKLDKSFNTIPIIENKTMKKNKI